jgi:hypothetical protein
MLTSEQITEQSKRAYNQWCLQWRAHSQEHSKYDMKSLSDFEHVGIGKAIVCVANGYSLELEMETLKSNQHNVDILCCDKSLGHLLDHGIVPTYVMVCDANVNYEKYLKPWEDQLQDSILFMNVCGNPLWTEKGNWKDRYFFTNMDVLRSEEEFMRLSGCPNKIPAGTNVSNALVILLTQSDNTGRRNFFAYDKILLVGFDYAWRLKGHYYAFDPDGGGKHHYMRHMYLKNIGNDLCFTSHNLAFSAKWLDQYINTYKLPVIQCSRESILPTKNMGVLSEQMQYTFKPEDAKKVRKMVDIRRSLIAAKKDLEDKIATIAKDHYYSYITSV